jgi:hypothetical protein
MGYRSSRANFRFKAFFIGLCLIAPFLLILIIAIYCQQIYSINCGGHLKRAADANTVEMAKKELDVSLKYLEDHKMTQGSTAVFWNTPDTDIGFWYQNIKSSFDELNKITSDSPQLERTNVLMKLRETLLDHGEDGDTVTEPNGIELYPFCVLMNWLFIVSVPIGLAGLVIIFTALKDDF